MSKWHVSEQLGLCDAILVLAGILMPSHRGRKERAYNFQLWPSCGCRYLETTNCRYAYHNSGNASKVQKLLARCKGKAVLVRPASIERAEVTRLSPLPSACSSDVSHDIVNLAGFFMNNGFVKAKVSYNVYRVSCQRKDCLRFCLHRFHVAAEHMNSRASGGSVL